jgi:mono/diheme cytochrome c family protein
MGRILNLICCTQMLLVAGAVWADTAQQRGAYLAHMGGCHACHTGDNDALMAGGIGLITEVGTFYPPNITPDPDHGIGNWNQDDFNRAMQQGISPTGDPYYPAFPYTSYTRMTNADLVDLKAYLDSLPGVAQGTPEHDLSWPFSLRSGLKLWQWINFTPQEFTPDNTQSAVWNRGAYIVNGPGHCGECHTPRTLTMALDNSLHLQGNPQGPDGELVPGIDMSLRDDKWLAADIIDALQIGITPEGDFLGGSMADVIDHTSQLTEADIHAIANYLSQP